MAIDIRWRNDIIFFLYDNNRHAFSDFEVSCLRDKIPYLQSFEQKHTVRINSYKLEDRTQREADYSFFCCVKG